MTPEEKATKLFNYYNDEDMRITHLKVLCFSVIDEITDELDCINELVEWDDDIEKEKRYDYWSEVKKEILKL